MANYEDQGTAYDPFAVGHERVGRAFAPIAAPRSFRIGTATVTYTWDGAVTRYDDGSHYGAQPHDTPDYCEVTQRCGYGTDTLAFCREHDAMHLICAEWFGFGDDNVIWKLAHGSEINLAEAAREEMMVQTVQAWVRGGIRPIIGGVDWDGLKARALALLEGVA